MSILLFFILMALNLATLWLACKFFGKTGLLVFSCVQLGVSIFFAATWPYANVFGIGFPIITIFIATFIYFAVYYMDKFSKENAMQYVILTLSTLIFIMLVFFIVFSFYSETLQGGWEVALKPFLFILLAIVASAAVIFVVKKYLTKLKSVELNTIIALIGGIFAFSFVYNMLAGIGIFGFGTMLLQVLITFIFGLIYLTLLYLFEKLFLIVNNSDVPNSTFVEAWKQLFQPIEAIPPHKQTPPPAPEGLGKTKTTKEEKNEEQKPEKEESKPESESKEENPEEIATEKKDDDYLKDEEVAELQELNNLLFDEEDEPKTKKKSKKNNK